MDARDGTPTLRQVMGSYPTGVTIVSALDSDGEPFGLTVNSFTSLSLDPPLVLVCVGHTSRSHDRLVTGQHFSVNMLASDQGDVAMRFAKDPSEGRFDRVEWSPAESGSPFFRGATAALDCSVHSVLDGGDHSILVGRVDGVALTDRPALIYHRGRFSSTDP
ncbi:MAG: flavin reductase family protein [Gemmatimonadota bacterium]